MGDIFEWFFDGKVLEAYNTRVRSGSQRIYEVHVLDLVIDEETGDIVEIRIDPGKYEAPQLIEYLRERKLLK